MSEPTKLSNRSVQLCKLWRSTAIDKRTFATTNLFDSKTSCIRKPKKHSLIRQNIHDNWGFEFYYNRVVTPWFHLTPNIQVLQNSNGDTDTSLLLGLRGIIDL